MPVVVPIIVGGAVVVGAGTLFLLKLAVEAQNEQLERAVDRLRPRGLAVLIGESLLKVRDERRRQIREEAGIPPGWDVLFPDVPFSVLPLPPGVPTAPPNTSDASTSWESGEPPRPG